MSELESFAASVVGNLDLAGAFADWLEERGDPRGVLLRRRWKRWLKERGERQDEAKAYELGLLTPLQQIVNEWQALGAEVQAEMHARVTPNYEWPDAVFRDYVRRKFGGYA